jgi:hypothetical protein
MTLRTVAAVVLSALTFALAGCAGETTPAQEDGVVDRKGEAKDDEAQAKDDQEADDGKPLEEAPARCYSAKYYGCN